MRLALHRPQHIPKRLFRAAFKARRVCQSDYFFHTHTHTQTHTPQKVTLPGGLGDQGGLTHTGRCSEAVFFVVLSFLHRYHDGRATIVARDCYADLAEAAELLHGRI